MSGSDAPLTQRSFVALWLTLCLDMIGFGIIIPVLPFHAERFGASPTQVAMLAASFSLAQLFAAPLLGRLGDRLGRRRVLLISIAGSCSAMLLLSVADSLLLLFAARLLAGSCNANLATAQAYVADRLPPSERARAMGVLGSAIGVGFVLGPTLGGLLSVPAWPALPFAIAATLTAIDWLLAFAWLPESRPSPSRARSERGPSSSPLRRAELTWLMLINLGSFAAFAAMESTFALLVERRLGYHAWEVGLLFTLVGVVSVLAQALLVGRIVARAGEAWTLRLGLLTLALGLLTIGLGVDPLAIAFGAAVVALGNAWIFPTLNAAISRRAAADQQGRTLGVASSAASLGRVLGPLGGGLAFELLGPGWPALLGACSVVVLVVIATLTITDR